MINRNRSWLAVLGGIFVTVFAGSGYAGEPADPWQMQAFTNSHASKQEQWFWNQRSFPLGYIPAGARTKALQQASQLQQNAANLGPSPNGVNMWTNFGPAPILGGQVSPPQPVSGRIETIAVDPSDVNHWLVGAAQGGVWSTRDAGNSWVPLTDNQASLAMGAIAFAPSNPAIIYAGTGEAAYSGDSYAGAGLLKSVDGGVGWQLLGASAFAQSSFSAIRVSPTDPNTLLASTTLGLAGRGADSPPSPPANGIFKSIDGGVTWSLTLKGQGTDIASNPTNFANQYGALGFLVGSGVNGIYRSTDTGSTWSLVNGPWGNNGVGRIQLAIAPSAPATLYVSIQDASFFNFGGSLGVWRTDNAWDPTPTWTQLPAIPTFGNQFWYDHVLTVDPTSPSILYLGETPLWKYDGTRWTAIGGDYDPNVRGIKIHPDQHALAWVGNTLIDGNDGGVWTTSDGGNNFSNRNTTLAITQFYDGSVHPTNPNMAIGGSQDNGTELWTGSNAWQFIAFGDGADNAISTSRPDTDWAVSLDGLQILRTTDGGNTFIPVDSSIDHSTAPFVGRFEKSFSNDDVFIAGTDQIWKTTNFFSGASPSWSANGPSMGADITALGFAASDTNSSTYAYGTADGRLRITSNGGAVWNDLDPLNNVPDRNVTGMAFHPFNANVLYVSLSGFDEGTPGSPGHVFVTTNALSAAPTWTDVSTPVNIPHNTVVVDPVTPNNVYVGTDLGVWKSLNAGASWTQLGTAMGMPNVAVFELKINRVTNRLFAFTHGRSAFYLSLAPGINGADLGLTMRATPNALVVGSNLTYTITVANNGPLAATNVVVTQTLPPGAVFVSANSSQGSSQHSGGNVTCTLGRMNAGATATISVVVIPTTVGNIFSTASVSSNQADPDTSNNTATVLTRVFSPTSDLQVAINATPNPVANGAPLAYVVSVSNKGPSSASNVILTNVLPASVFFNSGSVSQGTFVNSGGTMVCSLGVISSGGSATANILVTPTSLGSITATAAVTANQADPVPGNNTASVTTTVSPAADLGVTLVASPGSIVFGSNFLYGITVTNRGPNTATGVTLSDTLPAGLGFVSAVASQGTVTPSGNFLTFNIGSLGNGGVATELITMAATSNGTFNNTVNVLASQADPNLADNSATVKIKVAAPFTNIVTVGAKLLSESITPANGAIDVGETVTVSLTLQNNGNVSCSPNLTAVLQAGGGVTAPSSSQVYGALAPGGIAVSKPFTFTASGTNGGTITATLLLQDGANNLPPVIFNFPLPSVNGFANTNSMIIADSGPASLYPSTINVSGLSGLVGKITVTVTNLNHTYSDDVDMLLVGPAGQKVLLMSDAGGGSVLSGVSLTFDDAAESLLPQSSQILSGNFKPSQYGIVNFPTNAPAQPYDSALAVLNGSSPNGTWSLYVMDDSAGDSGSIVGGWSLGITTITPVNQVADLALTGVSSSNAVLVTGSLTNTFTITNNGRDTATDIVFTNTLPANASFILATSSQGSCLTNGANVICSLGNLAVGSNATIMVVVSPTAVGGLTNRATVGGFENDLNLSNNILTLVSTANPTVADLGVAVSALPNPVVVGSNVTYTITVTNNGPDTALGVVVTDALPVGLTFISANSASGTTSNLNGTATCNLGNLASGSGAVVTVIVSASQTGAINNNVTVSTASNDPMPGNNSASISITSANPAPHIAAVGAKLLAESLAPANGGIDPGETVTVSLTLTNNGSANTSSGLTATLQNSGGVTSSSGSQTYGALVSGGAPATRSFSFTAIGTNGGNIVATLQLVDGTINLGTVTFMFNLPASTTFANAVGISIPDSGPASPYPSTINITGMTGLVSKVTATLNNLNHAFPNDVNALLVGPAGQKIILMSGSGGGHGVTNVTLTFDDAAASVLPASSQVVSGTFKPSNNGLGGNFPYPAPAGPYTQSLLSTFNGMVPNGAWSLYVLDNSAGDAGNIAAGWSLAITTINPINSAADLQTSLSGPLGSVSVGNFTYTVHVTNNGPAVASNAFLTDSLPAGLGFVSASTSQGTATFASGAVTCSLGTLAAGANATVAITVSSMAPGVFTNAASVTATEVDLNLDNNKSQAMTTVVGLLTTRLAASNLTTNGSFQLTLTGQAGQTYEIQASTNLVNWIPIATNTLNSTGIYKYIDSNSPSYNQRYYRAAHLP